MAIGGPGKDCCRNGKALGRRNAGFGDDKRRRAIGNGGGIGRRDRAILGERGLQRRDFIRICLAGLFINRDGFGAFAGGDFHGYNFAIKRAAGNRILRAG